jgi:hypothetical protein
MIYEAPDATTAASVINDACSLGGRRRRSKPSSCSLRKCGVDVTLEIVPEMQHVFQFLAWHCA